MKDMSQFFLLLPKQVYAYDAKVNRYIVALYALFFIFTVSQAKPVTLEKAAAVAGKICKVEFNPNHRLNARAQSAAEPAYYVFTGKETGGFVIVSGDDIAKPILAYSLDGTMTDDDSLPPNMQVWLDDVEQQIRQARERGVIQSAETAKQWQAPAVGETVTELQTALWHQSYPFNMQCPLEGEDRCVTGCVPTAYAILMRYYGYPSQGRGTTESYVIEGNGVVVPERNLDHPYNWDQMPLEYLPGEYTQEQADAVATLMADVGAAIQVSYGANETGGTMAHEGIFRHFSLNPGTMFYKTDYSSDEWNTMLKNELGKSRPVMYRGAPSAEEGGHAFLLVGYTDQDYFLVNWGWGGYYNGAFALDALDPGESHYSGMQIAYFDCVPSTMLPTVAVVNDTWQAPSLKAALAMALADGSTAQIKMLKDAPVSNERVLPGKKVVLDLNGRTLDIMSYGFYNYGHFTVVDTNGSGKITVKSSNSEIICNYGELWVQGGEFLNESTVVGDYDYRRCIWSGEGSKTTIINGKFTAPFQTLCFNGDAVIEDGEFTTKGNAEILGNYNTSGQVTINGGTFTNEGAEPTDTDYRRCVWTAQGTTTLITGGVFTNNSMTQTLCFNGNATISGGTIENTGTGIDCASNSYVTITDCKMGGRRNVYAWSGTTLECSGGLYSQEVQYPYLASGYGCVSNDDESTKDKYPYRVAVIDDYAIIVDDTRQTNSLEEAIAMASTDGSTTHIKILKDLSIGYEKIDSNKNIQLDLNGCTLTILFYGFYNYGHLTIVDTQGTGKMVIDSGNYGIFANYNELWVRGGEFLNLSTEVGDADYRRCIWSDQGTKTYIVNGKFTSPHQTLCFRGDAVIEDGEFTTNGNAEVLGNHNTSGQVTIKGGTFTNAGAEPSDTDYRRCVWTAEGTTTLITGGVFTNCSKTQTLCFNGNATISGGTIENTGTGIDCLSNAHVTITDCKIGGMRNLYVVDGATLECSGGLYSQEVTAPYLASGFVCINNDDVSTKGKYPYRVASSTGIELSPQNDAQESSYYGLDGILRTDKKSGLMIIRQKNGKTIKRYYR